VKEVGKTTIELAHKERELGETLEEEFAAHHETLLRYEREKEVAEIERKLRKKQEEDIYKLEEELSLTRRKEKDLADRLLYEHSEYKREKEYADVKDRELEDLTRQWQNLHIELSNAKKKLHEFEVDTSLQTERELKESAQFKVVNLEQKAFDITKKYNDSLSIAEKEREEKERERLARKKKEEELDLERAERERIEFDMRKVRRKKRKLENLLEDANKRAIKMEEDLKVTANLKEENEAREKEIVKSKKEVTLLLEKLEKISTKYTDLEVSLENAQREKELKNADLMRLEQKAVDLLKRHETERIKSEEEKYALTNKKNNLEEELKTARAHEHEAELACKKLADEIGVEKELREKREEQLKVARDRKQNLLKDVEDVTAKFKLLEIQLEKREKGL